MVFWCAVFGAMAIYALATIGDHPDDQKWIATTIPVVVILAMIIYLHIRFELSLYDISLSGEVFTATRFDYEPPITFSLADIESVAYRPSYPRSSEQLSLRVRFGDRTARVAFCPADNFRVDWRDNATTRRLLALSGQE